MTHRLNDLRQALVELGSHLDSASLAEMATAEAAGEDVQQLYPVPLQHVEHCQECAEAYYELAEMMLMAVAAMSLTATAVSPAAVYESILLRELAGQKLPWPSLPQLVRRLVATLPQIVDKAPEMTAVTPELILSALKNEAIAGESVTPLVTALVQAVRRHLTAFTLFLNTMAETTWGHAVRVAIEAYDDRHALQLMPAPAARAPLLSSRQTGPEWRLLNQTIATPLPLQVEVQAARLSPLACTLSVRVDRPGLMLVEGRDIEISYQDRLLRQQTDKNGIALFSPVPIAALPHLTLSIRNR
jgi:hypothetical protein